MEAWPKYFEAGCELIRLSLEDVLRFRPGRHPDVVRMGEQGRSIQEAFYGQLKLMAMEGYITWDDIKDYSLGDYDLSALTFTETRSDSAAAHPVRQPARAGRTTDPALACAS